MSGWGSKVEWPDSPVITSEGKELPDNPWPSQIWPNPPIIPEQQLKVGEAYIKQFTDMYGTEATPEMLGIKEKKIYNNVKPTHDPYSNPNSHIYYECQCGAILDPGTKSFAALNNAASMAGWKIRWGEHSYVPYCVDCGKDVE